MSESQRAAVAAKLANIGAGQFADNQQEPSANLPTPQVSHAEAAAMLNVSTRSVAAAAKVRQAGACRRARRGHAAVATPASP